MGVISQCREGLLLQDTNKESENKNAIVVSLIYILSKVTPGLPVETRENSTPKQ